MATTLILKRRILASQNVSKTTRAMQMIAASKLKRAQEKAQNSRPYSEKLVFLSQNIVRKLEESQLHRYMKISNNATKTLLIVFAPDKGLCGSLIANMAREILSFDLTYPDTVYLTVGKKVEKIVASLKKEIVASFKFGTVIPSFDLVYPIATIVNDYFLNNKVKEVKIITSHFLSVFQQKPQITKLLPIEFASDVKSQSLSTLFEPKPKELLPMLLTHYLEISIYQSVLESFASEQAARMIAMKNATDNALDVVSELKLEYNKARQEKITNEILDVSGATFSKL